jgi:hypothetical protein
MLRSLAVRRIRTALAFAVLALFVLPAVVTAHAALDEATPKDGAVVLGTPTEVSATYTQNLDPDGTSLKLLDASGTVLAEGVIDPENVRRMFVAEIPELAPGLYEVRSTTLSAEDDELDRATWRFTVEAAPPSPSSSPTPTSAPSATPTPSAPSAAPATPNPTPAPTAPPTQAPSAGGSDTSGGGDVLLPIIAAVVIVAVIAGWLFSRRDRPPTQT